MLTIILISIATFVATLLGGLFALKLKDKLHLILGFSAGAVIAVAFFDLMPESLNLGGVFYSNSTILAITALGFVIYLLLDRLVFLHFHDHDDNTEHADGVSHIENTTHAQRGILGAGSLCFHSFLDGVAIGLAFQVSAAIGAIVAVAVLVHDFSDGINTVNMILKNKGEFKHAIRWLVADALAPVVGVVATMFFKVSEQNLGVILALFAGFFLYIGASDLIPESQHAHPKFMTTLMTLLGVAILYGAIRLAGL